MRKWSRENETDKVWWLDTYGVYGLHIFSFNKKKQYNLFADYPDKLSVEEWIAFNTENPFWEEFFIDRNIEYSLNHSEEIERITGENFCEFYKRLLSIQEQQHDNGSENHEG